MNNLKNLPKIDKIVANEIFFGLNKNLITKIAREKIALLRADILENKSTLIDEKNIILDILTQYKKQTKSSLISLINATGIIIHTNLGRSPLHVEVFEKAKKIACGYNNLEYDMKKGKRGQRHWHLQRLLCDFLGVEDVVVVNNNAAAVFLVLNTFGNKKQTVVSRGELVEIGGSFRIPEVMKLSGSKLVEIGTTNKTNIDDYENAICEKTSILMKVHQSNFSISGFTQSVSYEEIIDLANKKKLIDYFDIGGAYLETDLSINDDELNLNKILKLNPSIVSFSGDKLLGSIQAGIIVGKKNFIEKIKKNQLLRMLRVDKITLSLLESTFLAYLEGKINLIPTLNLIRRNEKELTQLCLNVKNALDKNSLEIIKTSSYVGGGTMPQKSIDSMALHVKGNAVKLEKIFRKNGIIGRIDKDRFLLDFRSILQEDLALLIEKLKKIL